MIGTINIKSTLCLFFISVRARVEKGKGNAFSVTEKPILSAQVVKGHSSGDSTTPVSDPDLDPVNLHCSGFKF